MATWCRTGASIRVYRGNILYDRAEAPPRHQQSRHRGRPRQQDCFDDQLPDEPPPAGAQGGPHGHFSLPSGAARQKHAGHVRADDHQHERHRSQQRPQRRAESATHFPGLKGFDDGAPARVRFGILCGEAVSFQVGGGLGLLHGDSRPQTRHHLERAMLAVGLLAPR